MKINIVIPRSMPSKKKLHRTVPSPSHVSLVLQCNGHNIISNSNNGGDLIFAEMRKYKIISRTGEGKFSTVVKAQHTKTRELFAIKCMKSSYESVDQVSSLREIQALKRLAPHPNIVKLEEVLFDPPSGRLALVFELLEGNLYELMKGRTEMFSKDAVNSFMRQIFTALTHMHSKGVFHRDIKPENILFDRSGKRLKLADFGSCRGMNGKPPFTERIATRWYCPSEVLLTSGMYGPEMDVWGAGCIHFELTTLYPLFPGTDKTDMINRMHKVLGTPSENTIAKLKPHASVDLRFSRQEGFGLRDCYLMLHQNVLIS